MFLSAGALANPSEGTAGKIDESPLLDSGGSAPEASPKKSAPASTVTVSVPADSPTDSSADMPVTEKELQETLRALRKQLASMEKRVEALSRTLKKEPARTASSGKLEGLQKLAKELSPPKKSDAPKEEPLSNAPVIPPASEKAGTPPPNRLAQSDPESGFVNDESVQSFRNAMILFRAQKFPEAVLAFSGFVESFPDHPLAGTAQFYVGESYYREKEYKLAVREFQRVLTSYDRSSHVAETLRDLAEAEDLLKQTEDAARHRQLLMSLFPHSPFAITQTASSRETTAPSGEARPESPPHAAGATSPAPQAAKRSASDSPPATAPIPDESSEATRPSSSPSYIGETSR